MEISEEDNKVLKLVEELVATGVARGIKQGLEQAKNEEKLKNKITFDIKLKNTKLLLKNYRRFISACKQATISEKELETATVEEILDKLYCSTYDEVTVVQSILASKKRTEIILEHIKNIVNFYMFEAESSGNDEKIRRAKIIKELYIDNNKQPSMSLLAEKNHVSLRQLHRDKNIAIEEIAVLMFGVDGIRKM